MKSGLDGDHACWHVSHSRLPHGTKRARVLSTAAAQLVYSKWRSTLRATTPSATLSAEERTLLFVYCQNHWLAK